MTTKEIIGVAIFGLSVGGMFYLYFGYVKPRMDVANETKALSAKQKTTT